MPLDRFLRNLWPSGAVAGIVIRAHDIELLAVQGQKVLARVRVPLDGPDAHQLGGAIRQALEAGSVRAKRVAVSVPSHEVLLRFFTMPVVPKPEWDAAVQFEARKYIPFKAEQLVWASHVVPLARANRLDVVFAAISRELFQKIQEACRIAGVQPALIEPRGLSLARLLEPGKGQAPDEFACIVDVEENTGHLAIVKNRLPYLTRTIQLVPSPSDPAAGSAPAQTGGPPGPEAWPAPMPPAPEAVLLPSAEADALDARAHRLFSELSVSMDFFTREHPATTIPRVVLCGDEGLVGPWSRWLAEQLRCQVELGSALVAREAPGVPLSSASAVGLLRARQGARDATLDFLSRATAKPAAGSAHPKTAPARASAMRLQEAFRSPMAVLGAVLAACLLAALGLTGAAAVRAERLRLQQRISAAPDDGSGLRQLPAPELEALKQKAAGRLALLKQVMGPQARVAPKLDALARLLPDGVWITRLTFENPLDVSGRSQPRLTLSGACYLGGLTQELSAIQQLEDRVKRSEAAFGGFRSAQLGRIQVSLQDSHTYRTFELSCVSDRQR